MAGKREQAAITQVEARTAAQASHADSGEPKLVSTAKRRNKAAMPARKMNDEERAAHERKLIKSNAAMIAFGAGKLAPFSCLRRFDGNAGRFWASFGFDGVPPGIL